MRITTPALVVAVVALVAAAPASAATKTYAGTAAIGGKVAMDVKLGKKGTPKRITEMRAVGVPLTCEITKSGASIDGALPVKIKVTSEGTFQSEQTDAFGQTSKFKGKFSGKKSKRVKGTFTYAQHFPAEGPLPEENCTTGKTAFTLKKGAPDVVPTTP